MDTSAAIIALSEWFRSLIILAAGFIGIQWGLLAGKRSGATRVVTAGVAAFSAISAGAANYYPVRNFAGPVVCALGGEAAVASIGLLVLLGIAGSSGKQSNRGLQIVATVIAFAVLIVVSAAPLYWRYFARQTHANYPDSRGLLQQSAAITCAPAAAAMIG